MSPSKRRLIEDRATRNAARQVVEREVAWFKAGVGEPGFAAQALSSGKDYAGTVADGAVDFMKDNRGKLSGGLALATLGLATWLFRGQLGDLVRGMAEGLATTADENAAEIQLDNQQEP